MRRALIVLMLLALACHGANPRRLLMARHRSAAQTAGGGTYYDDDPDNLMQYCQVWLASPDDVDPIPDESGNGNTGDRSASGTTHETGDGDAWLKYNGASGKMTVTGSLVDEQTNVTVAIWHNATSLSSSGGDDMFAVGEGGGARGISLLRSAAKLHVYLYTHADSSAGSMSYTIPATNEWHHFAVTYDGTAARFYVDGSLSDSDPVTPGLGVKNAGDTEVGNLPGASKYCAGKMDDAAVFSHTLTAGQISTLYGYGPYN